MVCKSRRVSKVPSRKTCTCGGVILRPLKASRIWVCLKCHMGIVKNKTGIPDFIPPEELIAFLAAIPPLKGKKVKSSVQQKTANQN